MAAKSKRKKSRFKLKPFFIFALFVYIAIAIIGQQSEINNLDSEIAKTNEMISEKEDELSEIEDKENVYGSEEYVERVARERLGYVRPDETVFVDVTGK